MSRDKLEQCTSMNNKGEIGEVSRMADDAHIE
jgi:hypothetical protein